MIWNGRTRFLDVTHIYHIHGAEYEGKNVYVYQQLKLPKAPDALIVNCALLRPLIPEQVNHVDVNLAGRVRSLRFENSDGPKIVLA